VSQPLIKITATTAAEVCANFALEKEAQQLLRDGISPRDFVAALIENKRHVDAIDFLAHALPVREGIWWGCLCMQHSMGDNKPPPDKAAATAAVEWLMRPSEENRAAAKALALTADPVSPAGALAMAVSLTGGSIYPPELPFKAPPPFASEKAVARAVKLASIKCAPAKIAKTQRSYVELAIQVAEGRLI
jgi:uncharacterized protein DUF6931